MNRRPAREMSHTDPAIPEPLPVHPVHVTLRRARLRAIIPMDAAAMDALAHRLVTVPGVDRVLARPASGSVIVETHEPAATVLDRIEEQGHIRRERAPQQTPVRQTLQLGMAKADFEIRKGTDAALDLRTVIGLFLLLGAALQLTRGRVAGPATTLALGALSLINGPAPPDEAGDDG